MPFARRVAHVIEMTASPAKTAVKTRLTLKLVPEAFSVKCFAYARLFTNQVRNKVEVAGVADSRI